MLERDFQRYLKAEIKKRLPGSIVMKTDPNYIQGFPDLLILWNDRWAALEVKQSKNAHWQPNQEYYISKLHQMSFAAFIYPENAKEILNEMEQSLQVEGQAQFV